jgi:transcriptional regulator with XRE-family HTH domain
VPADKSYDQVQAEKLADKINLLYEQQHPPDRGPYSDKEVEAWLAEHADEGPTISANYLRWLRRAERYNPSTNHVRAIARFFQVNPAFLLYDDEAADQTYEQIQRLGILSDAATRGIAAKAASLDGPTQEWVLRMLDTLPGQVTHRHKPRRRRSDHSDTPTDPGGEGAES